MSTSQNKSNVLPGDFSNASAIPDDKMTTQKMSPIDVKAIDSNMF
jgi:hypothetical protein